MITVYVLQSKNKPKRYVGITNNLSRRLKEHRSPRSTVTKLLGDFELLMTESFPDYSSARKREKFLKSGNGRTFLNDLFRMGPANGG
ncbi:MAG: GIY-YIG nuclease family protein [Candidatus Neomarinimicrobiota bacterium]|nr:MAG: GIY-YIG nuclease family protein [Candidatus Neomarinimicrobiota bacterium]